MFGFLKRRKEDKLIEETSVIIGKALILDGYTSDEAHKIGLICVDLLLKQIGTFDGAAWVLAVRGMYVFQEALKKDGHNNEGGKKLIRSLMKNTHLCMAYAKNDASESELLVLTSINNLIAEE